MKTILLIEDDSVLVEMYKDKFQHEQFTVLTATDGKAGLSLALEKHPDLILLDIALPKLNGMEVLAKLRVDLWGKTVPVILLTNLTVDGKLLEEINKYLPVYCLLKANTTPETVLSNALEVLAS